MRACFGLVVIAALLGACGDDGVTIDTSEGNVCGQLADVACHNLFSCCTEGEIESFLHVSERQTQEQCQSDVQVSCERAIAKLSDSYDKKRVKFDANLMNNCLASIVAPSGTCAEVLPKTPWTDACMQSAWVGTVAPDGDCLYDFECQGSPDAFCAANQKCQARPGHGQPCGTGCAHEFYCVQNICQPRLPAGGSCTATNQCADKLFCDFSMSAGTGMGMCTAPQPAGAACLSNAGCDSAKCIPGTCAGPFASTCYKDTDCQGRCADDGSSCTTAANCATGTCQMSGFSCTTPTSCGTTDTCIFPVQCIPGDCVGDPVCSVPSVVVDYCTALDALPVSVK